MDSPKLNEVRSWLEKANQDFLASSCEFESLRVAAATLTPYAVTTRYPGDLPDISYQEAEEAYSFASQILEFIKSRLPEEALIS